MGKDLNGKSISTTVQQLIESSHCLVAFLSRRHELNGGGWAIHPWVIEEATWAVAKSIKVLRIVEEGVLLGGIAGDVEDARFPSGQFEVCIPKLLSFVESIEARASPRLSIRPVERRQVYSVIPNEIVEDTWGPEVRRLVEEVRVKAEQGCYDEALQLVLRTANTLPIICLDIVRFTATKWVTDLRQSVLATQAVSLEPKCWRAHLSRGVALVHMRQYAKADEVFDSICHHFSENNVVVAKALHNKGWLSGVRDGLGSKVSLQTRKELYLQVLALDNRRIFTRALVLICMVLLGEHEDARPFLEASLRWEGFSNALREELETLGNLGHQALQHFPDWLRDLLYPSEGTRKGVNRYEH